MTRFALGLFAAALLASASAPARAPQDAKAKAQIEAAMKKAVTKSTVADARTELEKFKAGKSEMTGKMNVGGMSLDFKGTMNYSTPGKVNMNLTVTVGGQDVKLIQIVNGAAAKQTENGKNVPVIGDALSELTQSALLQEVALLYPLVDTKSRFVLKDGATPQEVVVKGADGVGLSEVTLLFSDDDLVKMTRQGISPSGGRVTEVTSYSEYTAFGAIRIPKVTKVSHDGKPFLDITVTDFKDVPKPDDTLFNVN